jgi:hypothetical protein
LLFIKQTVPIASSKRNSVCLTGFFQTQTRRIFSFDELRSVKRRQNGNSFFSSSSRSWPQKIHSRAVQSSARRIRLLSTPPLYGADRIWLAGHQDRGAIYLRPKTETTLQRLRGMAVTDVPLCPLPHWCTPVYWRWPALCSANRTIKSARFASGLGEMVHRRGGALLQPCRLFHANKLCYPGVILIDL